MTNGFPLFHEAKRFIESLLSLGGARDPLSKRLPTSLDGFFTSCTGTDEYVSRNGVDYCMVSHEDGNVLLEYHKNNLSIPAFIGSPSILIGDIDVDIPGLHYSTEYCVPNKEYAHQLVRLAIDHWDDLSWAIYDTPGGVRFVVDTKDLTQSDRDKIMQATACDNLYRLICKRRGYYSARLIPKEGRKEVVTSSSYVLRDSPSNAFYELVELHDDWVSYPTYS